MRVINSSLEILKEKTDKLDKNWVLSNLKIK